MGRVRTGRESYNTSINAALLARLRDLAKDLGKRQNELVEEAIKALLDKYKNGKYLSDLTRFLISEGYSYEEAKKGLEPAVSWWEESVAYIEKSKCSDIGASEEYDHDLWPRTELFKLIQYASKHEKRSFEERVEAADQKFINATTEINSPIGHVDNPNKEIHWWLFRYLKK